MSHALTVLFPPQDLCREYSTVMVLIKLARNRLYEAIAQSGLDPSQCTLEDTEAKLVITHNSGSTYVATAIEESRYMGLSTRLRFKVEADVIDGTSTTCKTKFLSSGLLPSLQRWADEVKNTTEAPDYWEDVKRNREFIADVHSEDSGNAPFTQDEQDQIVAQLQAIKKFVAGKFELTSEQMAQVEEKLDEVSEASKRMGRKDWRIYFLGTVTELIITATLPSGIGEHIFTMVVQGLIHLFTGVGGPPQILG